MKRGIITINNGVVGISTAPVWMVQEEIAGFVRCSRFYIIGGIFLEIIIIGQTRNYTPSRKIIDYFLA